MFKPSPNAGLSSAILGLESVWGVRADTRRRRIMDDRETKPMKLGHERVLLVDSRPGYAQALRPRFERAGVELLVARNGREAAALRVQGEFNTVLLPVLLPDAETLRLLQECHAQGIPVQALVLPTYADSPESSPMNGDSPTEADVAVADERNSEDGELEHDENSGAVIRVRDLQVDTYNQVVRRQRRRIALTRMEYLVLECLARSTGKVVSREQILRHTQREGDTRCNIVDVYIRYLRRKIDAPFDVPLIRTRYGKGYMLGETSAAAPARKPS